MSVPVRPLKSKHLHPNTSAHKTSRAIIICTITTSTTGSTSTRRPYFAFYLFSLKKVTYVGAGTASTVRAKNAHLAKLQFCIGLVTTYIQHSVVIVV